MKREEPRREDPPIYSKRATDSLVSRPITPLAITACSMYQDLRDETQPPHLKLPHGNG